MATQEKLLKSLESLKNLINSPCNGDQNKKKEKMQHCLFVSEALLNPTIKIAKNFNNLLSFAIHVLLQLCDDNESDVRMIADECLNKIIKGMSHGNITKIQIELHTEIKRNGSARSLRAALWRFSLLAHYIRPNKGKPYVVNLIPCLVKIFERSEEIVHETLATSLPKIMTVLGCFTMDNDIKNLLAICLKNILSTSTVIRRTTANSITTIVLNSRKPLVFLIYVLNNIIDNLIPVTDGLTSNLILGVLGCLKIILPHIKEHKEKLAANDFIEGPDINENKLLERYLQIYELTLHFCSHSDHNVVNASLETLNTLLLYGSPDLLTTLLSTEGITKSRILYQGLSKANIRSPSQLSIATTLKSEENLLLDSELSDSFPTDIEKWIDESKLSVINVNYVKDEGFQPDNITEIENDFKNIGFNKNCDYSNISIGTIQDNYNDNLFVDNIDGTDKTIFSENSSEKSFSTKLDEKSLAEMEIYLDIDIGDFLDKNISLQYAARFIAKQFLLEGIKNRLIPDKKVRVSTKNLALTCLSNIVQIHPNALLIYLNKHCAKDIGDAKDILKQQMSEVFLFKDHSDPQLRGAVRIIISNFIKAVLLQNYAVYDDWIIKNSLVDGCDAFILKNLLDIILKGLQQENSTCSRQTLISLNNCLKYILETDKSKDSLQILNEIPILSTDPYWLVKVKLLEVVSDLNYITIRHVTESNEFQNRVIYNILFHLLGDEDQRVRSAAVTSIIRIIPSLYFGSHYPNETSITIKAIYHKNKQIPTLTTNEIDSNTKCKQSIENMPFPYHTNHKHLPDVEESLSIILFKIFEQFMQTTSKYFTSGFIELLSQLSTTFPTTNYKMAWNCFKNIKINHESGLSRRSSLSFNFNCGGNLGASISSSGDLFNLLINLLTTSTIGYDLNSHLNLLKVSGNIFAGKSIESVRVENDINSESNEKLWIMFEDLKYAELSEVFLIHLLKLLNIYSHIIDDTMPSIPQIKQVLPNLPSTSNLSPIKRKKSDLGDKKILSPGKSFDKEGDKKVDLKISGMGYFVTNPHYMKIYEIIRSAYNNYKITLDPEASANFTNFLEVILFTLSQILEIATLKETGRVAEEILFYLKSTFTLASTATVQCVRQLLKSLFGTNLTANAEDIIKYINKSSEKIYHCGFYNNIAQKPVEDLSFCIHSLQKVSKVDCDGDSTVMGYLHRKETKKPNSKSVDTILANYIRIFEPIVIKALKHYTITSNVKFQSQVLQLLSQLVQLRVNYCLLDSEQIFIGFVLKQFEYIEEGQIHLPEEIIPNIFHFLVNLSYEKHHSKSIIVIPKIIQLCDGLMASGQSPLTHCIPSLKPTVEDVFLLRNKSNTSDFKELETTREVLVSILCRLIEFSEVMDLLVLILNESKYCESSEKWSRWSQQILEILLPLLKLNKVRLDDEKGMDSVKKLIFNLHPCIYQSINEVLVVLFSEPPEKKNILSKYLGKILVSFLLITQLKEDVLLLKLVENQEYFSPQCVFIKFETPSPDPLNVTKTLNVFKNLLAEDIFIQFCFHVIYINVRHCLEIILTEEDQFVVQQFHNFLLYMLYIFQSGNYPRITEKAILLLSGEECKEEEKLPIDDINKCFVKLQNFYPLLTFHWCYILTLLNYNNRKFWSTIMQLTETYGIYRQIKDNMIVPKKHCCNMEIVRIGGSIVFSDYLSEHILSDGEQMSWFLVNNINFIVNYNKEAPVFELLGSVHRNSAASGLVLQAIVTKCLDKAESSMKSKILNCIENVHPSQTGTLLQILIPKVLNTKELSVSRQVAKLASRKIEYLLTLTSDEVLKHLPKEDVVRMMDTLISMKLAKKHESLVSLLNKLASQFYDASPLELDQRRPIKANYIKTLTIDRNWYLSQIKLRCHFEYSSLDVGELLYTLSYDELITIMGHSDFNKAIILECLNWCINNSEKNNSDLLKACSSILLKDVGTVRSLIPKPHQVYKPEGREATPLETKYSSRLTDILWDESVILHINNLIPCISSFLNCLSFLKNDLKIPDSHYEDFMKLAVFCLENVVFLLDTSDNELNINFINICLTCSNFILNETYLCNILELDVHITWLSSAVNSIYKLVKYLLKDIEPLPSVNIYNLSDTLCNVETRPAGQAVYQLSILFTWLQKKKVNNIPKRLIFNIQSIVISLCRMPLVNSYILTPLTAWKTGWNVPLVGPFFTQVPLLPIEYLQDVDILEEFIFGINLLGWTSRQQFEETWMCLLGVLCTSPNEESSQDEINAITHSTSLAVQAITSLLLQTLYLPHPGNKNKSKLIHVSRDRKIEPKSLSVKKLKEIHDNFLRRIKKHSHILNFDKLDLFNNRNIEKIGFDYSYSQVSVEYLQISAKVVENLDATSRAGYVYNKRQNIISHIGLDLNSCLQLLVDLFTRWIKSDDIIQLRLLQEVVKSILIISDLFTDKSQFQWMFEMFMDLSKIHTIEDEIIHQYIVIGVCKSIAVLSSDLEQYEYVKKLITQSLKTPFLSARISSIHGLLYILQMCVLGNTVIGGISEEMRLFLHLGIDYIQSYINTPNKVLNQSLEHTLLVWSLAFYLIEHVDLPNIEENFIESCINQVLLILSDVNTNMSVYIALTGGIERLLIKKKIKPKISSNIFAHSLEKIKSTNPAISLPAAQLLFTCMYTEYSNQLESTDVSNGLIESNPDHLEQTIEKVTALFDKIKKGFPVEVEILCSSMSLMLSDFFTPSDILTKAIGEYLSPQQRHPIQLSTVVFKIFESAIKQSQLILLQDWVVFSLANFTQSFSIGMATWCLTCFFISASTNPWLRALFPIVQKRIGRYEFEDRKILCIAGADFYNNLSYEGQKHTFVDTLSKVKDKVDMPFKELLECL